ncbi:MAG: IS30 family transposase, partial [Kiritimatiellae bacterium]|nr:IS30 family transposase [Kiritimatiellia bacterium]
MAAKGKRETPPRAPKYHRLTEEKRIIIETLRKEGRSCRHIAGRIGCAPSTVTRELGRNASEKGYRHKKAQRKADRRMMDKATARRKMMPGMWEFIKTKMREDWTPEQIEGRCRRDGIPMVSRETIYKEYYRRQKLVLAGESDEDLPPLTTRRKGRKPRDRAAKRRRDAGRGKIPGRVDIGERPKTVESRARVGNWEGDLINGQSGTGHLVVLAERMTRFVLFAYAATKEAGGVASTIIGLFAGLPGSFLGTLTFDNGKEFAKFGQIRQALGIGVYFAKPYHSWERGTNENRNGIVRKVLPKGRPFDDITGEEMRRIDRMLNDRPLKCLNWRTP